MSDKLAEQSREAHKELLNAVDELHELMHDPYKAPELTIEMLPSVQTKMWDCQVKWFAMYAGRKT